MLSVFFYFRFFLSKVPSFLEPAIHTANLAISGAKFSVLHYAIMGTGLNDAMPERPPTKSSALENLRGLIANARAREEQGGSSAMRASATTKKKLDVRDLWSALSDKNEEIKKSEEENSSFFRARGIFTPLEDIGDALAGALGKVKEAADDDEQIEELAVGMFSEEELEEACGDVFTISFLDFLEKYDMMALYPLMVYSYQVQGYGTIQDISAYYGLIWVTPGSMLKEVRDFFDPPEKGSTEDRISTVNVVDDGWLTLFEQIVERDLSGKIVLNTSIENVKRATM